ncbi:MAG: GC-type dockerin domain-anchored protein [Phycisphaerales bacterium]
MKIRTLGASMAALVVCGSAMAQAPDAVLMIPNSSNDAIATFDPFDGSLIDPVFIDLVPLDAGTPKHATQVGDEIWVSDQIRDRIDRFTLDGSFIGTIGGQVPGGGLDNVRGVNVIGGEVWVFNAGTNNDAPGNAIVRIDPDTATIIGDYPLSASPWFALPFGDDNLVSYSGTADTRIDRFDDFGVFQGEFLGTGELNFIQQVSATSGGNVLAAAFSTQSASGRNPGVYEIDATGAIVGVVAGTESQGPRAAWELGNGNILWTNGGGVNITDVASGVSTEIFDGSSQFISLLGDAAEPCYADFDGDGELTIFDFLAFQNAFDSGDSAADCDQDGSLTLFDFLCFQNAFDAGCE